MRQNEKLTPQCRRRPQSRTRKPFRAPRRARTIGRPRLRLTRRSPYFAGPQCSARMEHNAILLPGLQGHRESTVKRQPKSFFLEQIQWLGSARGVHQARLLADTRLSAPLKNQGKIEDDRALQRATDR